MEVALLFLFYEFEHVGMGLVGEQVEHDQIVVVDVFEQVVAIVFVLLCLAGHDGEADREHCLPLNHETLFDGLSFILGHLDMSQLRECAARH